MLPAFSVCIVLMCVLDTGHAYGSEHIIEDIITFFDRKLNEPIDMTVDGRLPNFTREMCNMERRVKYIQVADPSSRPDLCTSHTAIRLLLCVTQIRLANQFEQCKLIIQTYPRSLHAGKCALFITLLQMLQEYRVPGIASQDTCLKYGKPFQLESMLRLGVQLIRSCRLEQETGRGDTCRSVLNTSHRAGEDVRSIPFYLGQIYAKVSLVFAAASFQKRQQIEISTMCWEPELIHAQKLYQIPGRWDVDRRCVATLKTIGVSILGRLVAFLVPLHVAVPRSRTTNVADEDLLSILRDSSEGLLQFLVYPAFNRFQRHAEERHHSYSNSNVVVSCKGLRGSPQEAQDTAIRLFRLVITNELRLYHNSLDMTTVGVILNHLLLCFARYAI